MLEHFQKNKQLPSAKIIQNKKEKDNDWKEVNGNKSFNQAKVGCWWLSTNMPDTLMLIENELVILASFVLIFDNNCQSIF